MMSGKNKLRQFILLGIISYCLCCCSNSGGKMIKAKAVYSKETNNSKDGQRVITLIFEMGFDEPRDIRVFQNDKIVARCKMCYTNESIGFVVEEKTSKIYQFSFNYSDFKIGDVLKIEYKDEIVVYQVNEQLFNYQALYICRNFCEGMNNHWLFSFEPYRNSNIE